MPKGTQKSQDSPNRRLPDKAMRHTWARLCANNARALCWSLSAAQRLAITTQQNNSEQKRAKKQMNFPQIKSSERCGKCKTCLNPQMRKACLTRRAEMVTIGGVKQAPSPPLPRAVTTSAPATMTTVTTLDAFVVRSNDYEVID